MVLLLTALEEIAKFGIGQISKDVDLSFTIVL